MHGDLLSALDLASHEPPSLFRKIEEFDATPRPIPQVHSVKRAWKQLGLEGVLYSGPAPVAYLKRVRHFDEAQMRGLQRAFWNQGVAPVMIVGAPNEVRVYSSRALPAKDDAPTTEDRRMVRLFKRTADDLRALRQLVPFIENGGLFRSSPESFEQQNGVDQYLLRNLRYVREELRRGLPDEQGHFVDALLTRVIFTCYLVERGIIKLNHVSSETNKGLTHKSGNLESFLSSPPLTESKNRLYALFGTLGRTFNGSIFDDKLNAEREVITDTQIAIIRTFLSGDEVGRAQLSLGFWAYDFRIIPVETISAIYEDFIEQEGAGERVRSGAFYTPPHLAELLIDMAVGDDVDLLEKHVLDPACGSGIFLVSMFNRMAEEWHRRNPRATNIERAQALRTILENNLTGIDVHKPACLITCFSLYLAMLDQLEPRDIEELKTAGHVLPKLLVSSARGSGMKGGRGIVRQNFFAPRLPVRQKAYDYVLGNPPWVARENSIDPVFLNWCKGPTVIPIPEKQVALGFLLRAPKFLKTGGTGCLILPSAAILNSETTKFQYEWFKAIRVTTIVQLADLRYVLFPGAVHPAIILRFEKVKPAPETDSIEYAVPKATDANRKHLPVIIGADDSHLLRVSEVLRFCARGEPWLLWKTHFWGTPRDIRFIDRLRSYPPLRDNVGSPKNPKRWVKGQGFKPYDVKPRRPRLESGDNATAGVVRSDDEIWIERDWSDADHYVAARTPFQLALFEDQCEALGDRFHRLHRKPAEPIFQPPLVLFNQGFTKAAYVDFPIRFQHALQSIHGERKDAQLLQLLAIVLSSNLARYFLFHIAPNWGTERSKVQLDEVLRFPFPFPEDARDAKLATDIVEELSANYMRIRSSLKAASPERRLTLANEFRHGFYNAICAYYDVDDEERVLVEDTVNVIVPTCTPKSTGNVPGLNLSTARHRRDYLDYLRRTLNSWIDKPDQRISGFVTYSDVAGCAIVTLSIGRSRSAQMERVASEDLSHELKRIMQLLPVQKRSFIQLRNLKIFDGPQLHIVKPMSLRSWTRSTALNDADEIAKTILSSSGG